MNDGDIKPILFLDMDDTIVDTLPRINEVVIPFTGNRASPHDVWNYIAATQDHFFLSARPFDGLRKFLRDVDDWCRANEHDLQILTALPSLAEVPNSIEDKLEWVRRHVTPSLGREIKVNFGPFSKDKHKWARNIDTIQDILIDDRVLNIEQWNSAGGYGILHRSFDNTVEQLEHLYA